MIFNALGRRTAGVVGAGLLVAVGCGSDADSTGAGGASSANGNSGGSANFAGGSGHGTAGSSSGQSGSSSGGSSSAEGGADDGSGNETGGASSEGGAGGRGDDNSQGGGNSEGGNTGGGEGGAGGVDQGGSNPDVWTQCVDHEDCVLTPMSCCGSCGAVTPEDAAAVNSQYLSEFREAACGGPGICPACAGENDPRVSTYCGEDGHCVLDLALD